MADDECKTIKETDDMELVQNEEDSYTLYLWNRGVSVWLDGCELEELRKLLQ
jgi:glycyl-tRNA synthetase alpha subunit